MNFGHFDDANFEYVITDPRTPVKWINYVGTLEFGGFVDHTGGALLCSQDPALDRITKYIPQMPDSDFKGETLYLRITANGKTEIQTPFFVPGLDMPEKFECRVGLSYQKITSELRGIRTECTIFVPVGARAEIRDIKVTNLRGEPVSIDIVPVAEFSHFDAFKQLSNADWVPQTMMADAVRDGNMLTLRQYAFMKKDTEVNFMSGSLPADSFQTDRRRFLGSNGYGSWREPGELANPSLDNYETRRGDVICAVMYKTGPVPAGKTVRLISMLGQAAPEKVPALVKQYRDEKFIDRSFAELAAFWKDYLGRFQVKTPDAAFNSMVNVHNPRQCHTTLNWSRYLSLYQLGMGARGLGFRDSAQDVMGVLAGAPVPAKALMRKLLSVQLANGSAMHQFFPLTMEADAGDSREFGNKQYYCDDHLWIVLAVGAYLRETGDFDFLDEKITFYDRTKKISDRESGTVFEHIKRALEFTRTDTGKHGLPLLGFADWNDCVNLPGKAESLFAAGLYGRALLEMIDLADHTGNAGLAAKYRADYELMRGIVNDCGWDGEWFVRYFAEDGSPLGSHLNPHGSIFVNGQSWQIISGFAPQARGEQAMDSVDKHLNTAFGIKLSGPGFEGYDPVVGGISTYPPGAKENGGIFLHANPWAIIAETLLGRGDRAFKYYTQINPAAKNDIIDRYECEPYCYPQNILGDEHPQFGLARNTWLSGTATWTYQAATQYILGVRPAYGGLVVDPCIPKTWDAFSVTRRFRGATYNIEVKNPSHVSRGVKSMSLDGKPVDGTLVPLCSDGGIHSVTVELG